MWGGSPCLLYFATERAPIERANEQIKDLPMDRRQYQAKKTVAKRTGRESEQLFLIGLQGYDLFS